MENPQAQTNVQITTVDAISLLYYAGINVAPQPQHILEGLKNEAIKTYVHLITENERLTAEVAKLKSVKSPVVRDLITEPEPLPEPTDPLTDDKTYKDGPF